MLAYHGTGLSNYEEILKTQRFTFKKRNNHWLGNGVYFFIEDFNRAKRWAEGNRPNKNTVPVVIEADFSFESGELLDLDKSEDLEKVNSFARNFITILRQKKVEVKNIDEHEFQCKLLEAFIYRNKNYKAICRTLPSTGNPLIGPSKFIPVAKQLNIVDCTKINLSSLKLHNWN